ncbi:nicotianamine synthase family protein [Desulfonatronospira sp.]|uniref:nicotianamine synthase family protein n=1 Tax=Desulfonatronospira sp. TaxID=1962951 RepID=UPI0025B8E2C8|nr:nicotianamine synthase family protein [Desulfonatronospira sp.]
MSWIPMAVAAWEKMSSSSKILTWLYSRPYRQVIENEIKLANLGKDDIVLNIGCGAVPFTALYTAKLAGSRVYALDIDPCAAGYASQCVKMAGLEDRITVMHADGAQDFRHYFTASIVALQAAPKNRILETMQKKSPLGARFIFRLASHQYKDHYDCLQTQILPDAVTSQPMRTFDRSALYLNKEAVAGFHPCFNPQAADPAIVASKAA